jgi:hypothetical protein
MCVVGGLGGRCRGLSATAMAHLICVHAKHGRSLIRWRYNALRRPSAGTMRAGGSSAKRGSLASARISARSVSVSACAGVGRSAKGRPSPRCRPSPAFQRWQVRASMPTISHALASRAPAWRAVSIWAHQGLAIFQADHTAAPPGKIAESFFESTSSAAVSARASVLAEEFPL